MRICVPQRHKVGHHVAANLGIRRRRILLQQRLGAHDHSGDAITALRRLLVDEGALQRAGILDRAQSLDGR